MIVFYENNPYRNIVFDFTHPPLDRHYMGYDEVQVISVGLLVCVICLTGIILVLRQVFVVLRTKEEKLKLKARKS